MSKQKLSRVKFLNRGQVRELTGMCSATIWRWEREGIFPRRRQLGPATVRWVESEVLDWLASRPVVGEIA